MALQFIVDKKLQPACLGLCSSSCQCYGFGKNYLAILSRFLFCKNGLLISCLTYINANKWLKIQQLQCNYIGAILWYEFSSRSCTVGLKDQGSYSACLNQEAERRRCLNWTLKIEIAINFVNGIHLPLELTVFDNHRNRKEHGTVKKLYLSVYTPGQDATENSVKASALQAMGEL